LRLQRRRLFGVIGPKHSSAEGRPAHANAAIARALNGDSSARAF
jgi:hypothetical protein